jgi:hypothetical protein
VARHHDGLGTKGGDKGRAGEIEQCISGNEWGQPGSWTRVVGMKAVDPRTERLEMEKSCENKSSLIKNGPVPMGKDSGSQH